MFCIIWKPKDVWELFTNEVWAFEKEALEYAKRNKFKKSIKWKVADYKDWFQKD